MAKRTFLAGATSQTMDVFLQDSSSTIGAGLSGLVFNTANLKAYYRKGATGTLTAVTLATQTVGGAWSSGGFVEIDATNAKGLYRFDIPDTILASTPAAVIHFYGATNLAQNFSELEIVAYDPFNATSLGLSRLDAAITSRMATFTLPTNFSAFSIDASGRVDVIKVAGTTQTAKDIGGAVPAVAAGASGGLLISGSNAGTTTLGALTITGATTHTGNVILSDGLTISAPSTLNRAGIDITGNGTGSGMIVAAGATGTGIQVNTTAGDGISVTPTGGHAIRALGQGSTKHGFFATGSSAGTGDGIRATAGTGVDIRGNITGNLVGTVSTLTTYTGNTPQTADVATLITTVGAAGAGLTSVGLATTSRAGIRKNVALANFEIMMTDSTNHNPATGLTVTVTRSIDGAAFAAGTLGAVTELSNGFYKFDFAAGDLNGTVVTLRATAVGADDLGITIHTDP